jgi:hypothetical protein
MKFKLLLLSSLSLLAVGCSSTPTYSVKGYNGPEVMGRNEVIQAARECLRAKLRPTTEYVTRNVDSGSKILVPVDVRCDAY